MRDFTFYTPTRIVFGRGAELQAGAQAALLGCSRVLVIYGGQSARKSGVLDRVLGSLQEAGMETESIGGVQPNPRLTLVRECIARALEFQADLILGIGGGSVLDTCKAAAVGAASPDRDIWNDIWLKKQVPDRVLPVGAVLTIPAAGSECSDSSVISNSETHEKRGINSDLIRPRFALMNPELTLTLPKYQVCCGVVDILMHTLDRYFNPPMDGENALTDELAEALMRTVIRRGAEAVRSWDTAPSCEAMSELMWAGSLSHNGLTGLGGVRDFSVHQLGHELSAKFDAAHGATLSAVWSSWARYVVDRDPGRFARLGEKVLGQSGEGDLRSRALEAIDGMEDFFRSIGMPVRLTELGAGEISEEQLEDLAWRCTFYGARKVGQFQPLEKEDILAIYRAANVPSA